MSNSDSPLSENDPDIPNEARIETQLRKAVISAFSHGDFDNLTVKRVRIAATKDLELPENFLVNEEWKARSKAIIADEVAKQEEAYNEPQPKPPMKRAPKPITKAVSQHAPPSSDEATKPKKRKSSESIHKSQKRRRVLSSAELSSPPEKTPARHDQPYQSETNTTTGLDKSLPARHDAGAQDDESELSSLIDDSPPPKAKQRKKRESSEGGVFKAVKSKSSKSSKLSNLDKDVASQDEEIKELQRQLIKCGIRKLWGKELFRFDTSKEKIRHLRGMLDEVGMTGRFSEEKARQIKEERELRADLDAIKEGEEKWGREKEEPRKRGMAKGLQHIQDLVGDDEESD